jgi:hypothetical protein
LAASVSEGRREETVEETVDRRLASSVLSESREGSEERVRSLRMEEGMEGSVFWAVGRKQHGQENVVVSTGKSIGTEEGRRGTVGLGEIIQLWD